MTVLALGIAVMIGDGCCAFVSICLGKKDTDSAQRVSAALFCCVLYAVLF